MAPSSELQFFIKGPCVPWKSQTGTVFVNSDYLGLYRSTLFYLLTLGSPFPLEQIASDLKLIYVSCFDCRSPKVNGIRYDSYGMIHSPSIEVL